jgi:hypothetical protein
VEWLVLGGLAVLVLITVALLDPGLFARVRRRRKT